MDPYLEHRDEWRSFHSSYIAELGNVLNRQLKGRYVARIEKRIYLEDDEDHQIPDVVLRRSTGRHPKPSVVATLPYDQPETILVASDEEVEEWTLKLLRSRSHELVGIIELAGPSNKRPGAGRKSYLEKRRETMSSPVNWTEIDLLRGGRSTLIGIVRKPAGYAVFSSAASQRPHSQLWQFGLQDRLPTIAVPLTSRKEFAVVDLQSIFATVYDSGLYEFEMNRDQPLTPPLTPEQLRWARRVLARPR